MKFSLRPGYQWLRKKIKANFSQGKRWAFSHPYLCITMLLIFLFAFGAVFPPPALPATHHQRQPVYKLLTVAELDSLRDAGKKIIKVDLTKKGLPKFATATPE